MKENKTCPRCFYKMPAGLKMCPACGMNFDKLEQATNREGRAALRANEKERVVFTNKLPCDVNKWKLFFLTLFLGFTGAHMFRVGRDVRGFAYLILNILGIVFTFLPSSYFVTSLMYNIFIIANLAWAVAVIFWITDAVLVAFNKFKVPVSLPYRE
ncbi:MAG: hypothetical protein PHP83_01495 [Clostridia bacterium]|nr:hypothetical protein [Clostridia bacterium]